MFHYIEPFVQWKVSTDDKVLYGSIDANKEPVFFYCTVWQQTVLYVLPYKLTESLSTMQLD